MVQKVYQIFLSWNSPKQTFLLAFSVMLTKTFGRRRHIKFTSSSSSSN